MYLVASHPISIQPLLHKLPINQAKTNRQANNPFYNLAGLKTTNLQMQRINQNNPLWACLAR